MFLTRKKVLESVSRGNVITKDQLGALVPNDSLVVLLTQSSTDAPTAVVLHNTLEDVAPVLAYSGVGVYTLKVTGKFTVGKTVLPLGSSRVSFEHTDVDTITIKTYSDDRTTAANAILSSTPLEIKVYE